MAMAVTRHSIASSGRLIYDVLSDSAAANYPHN